MISKYLSFVLIISLNSCNSTKNLTSTFIEKSVKVGEKIIFDNCPDNGTCKITIKENSKIEVRRALNASDFPLIVEGNNTVYEYKYYNNNKENYQDGNDYEVVLFELNNDSSNQLINGELSSINAFFGKFCYCKDIQGYYKIDTGDFKLSKEEVHFSFIVDGISERQLIKNLKFKL